MLKTYAFFPLLLYESESDEKLSYEAYHGPATKEGGHKVIPRPLTVYSNITHTRRYLQFHQVSVFAILSQAGTTFTQPTPHTTNNNTTHAVKKIVFHSLVPVFFLSTSY